MTPKWSHLVEQHLRQAPTASSGHVGAEVPPTGPTIPPTKEPLPHGVAEFTKAMIPKLLDEAATL